MVPGAVRSGPRLYGEMLKNKERLRVLAKRRPRKLETGDGLGKKGSFSLWWQRGVNQRLFLRLNSALATIPKEFGAAPQQSRDQLWAGPGR